MIRAKSPTFAYLVGFAVFLFGVLGVHTDASSQASKPIRIGLTLGLSGKYAALTAMQRRAYVLWQHDLNAKGGLLGRKVELVIRDDESDPAKAAALYKEMIDSNRVELIFGPYSSAITLEVAPVVEKAGYPMLTPGAAADRIWRQGYRYIFGVSPPASKYTLGMLDLAASHGLRSIGIVHTDDAFATGAAKSAREWSERLGLKVLGFEGFKQGARDLGRHAARMAESKPDLVMMVGHFVESVDMRRALKSAGWYPKAYFATVGPVLPGYKDRLGADADLTMMNAPWDPRVSYSGSQAFDARFRAFHNGIAPSYQAAFAYAAGQILEAAVISAGGTDREPVRNAIAALETETIVGVFKVDESGVQTKQIPLTLQWQSGEKQIVWPKAVQTSAPVFR